MSKTNFSNQYKALITETKAISFLKSLGFSGFICAGQGPGGIDIICNRNGRLAIVELKGTEIKLSLDKFKSDAIGLKGELKATAEVLKYYSIEKSRQDRIQEREYQKQINSKDHYKVIFDNIVELEQTSHTLKRYLNGEDTILEKIWYIEGGSYSTSVEDACKTNNITLIHNEKIITKSQTFDFTFSKPPNEPIDFESPLESSKWDSLEEDYKGPDWQKETKGDIE